MYLFEKWSIQPVKVERMDEYGEAETVRYLSCCHCGWRIDMLERSTNDGFKAHTFLRG